MYQLSCASPVNPIVSVDELYEHLRIADTSEAAYLQALSLAAEAFLEKATGIGLQPLERTYYIFGYESKPGLDIPIHYGPVVVPTEEDGEIVNPVRLVAVLESGEEMELPVSEWSLRISQLRTDDLIGSAIHWLFTCTAGNSTPPPMAKQAIMLLVGGWYERRESVDSLNFSEIPFGARALIQLMADPVIRF